jgi:hypothetical protein
MWKVSDVMEASVPSGVHLSEEKVPVKFCACRVGCEAHQRLCGR